MRQWSECAFGTPAGHQVVSANLSGVPAGPIALAPDAEFAELIDDFLASKLSPRTRESYAADLVIFLTWIANRATHPRDVSRPDVDRYRNWLGELVDDTGETAANGHPRYAPATIARKLTAVRSLYTTSLSAALWLDRPRPASRARP